MSAVDSVISMEDDEREAGTRAQAAPSYAVCASCEEHWAQLYFCNVCRYVFCSKCWELQLAHRKKSLAPGAIPHEKTDLELAQRIHDVFTTDFDDTAFEKLHAEDQATAWFGIGTRGYIVEDVLLRDYQRYASLVCDTNGEIDPAQSHPSVVSFVGQTGAGKSTLVKLLIKASGSRDLQNPEDDDFPTPLGGIPGRELPTSADIHLYADPHTINTDKPILYADCEGLDGGTREPLAALYRRARHSIVTLPDVAEDDTIYLERKIAWANDDIKSARGFVVGHLYPRLLFAFSDVVVFVHQNPRTVENVLDKLMEWAASVETSSNQPVLPYAILVLNFCENNIPAKLWEVDTATKVLLGSLAETVDRNPSFKLFAKAWRARGAKIETVEDLLMCYYSSLKVVRIPADGRPNLMHEQGLKLYSEIQRGVSVVQSRKAKLRMLLNAPDFQTTFQQALDHYCIEIDKPFDFVQSSFSNGRLTSEFSNNILAMAIALKDSPAKLDPAAIFDKLGLLVASCIMLHAIRNNIRGTADRILPNYSGHIDAALSDFCYKHWPCEFVQSDLLPQSLQANWDNDFLFQVAGEQAVRYRCANVRVGHGTRGHQLEDGRYFAPGDYISSFSVEAKRTGILNKIYYQLHYLLERVASYDTSEETPLEIATRIHRDEVLRKFYSIRERERPKGFENTKFCITCLFRPAHYTTPCGDSLCRDCIKLYGELKSNNTLELYDCPLHVASPLHEQSRSIYIRPQDAGLRVLALDDGGVNSMVQVELLKMLEKEFQGKLSLQCFFDLVVGEGTGGVLALGLACRGWTAQDCEKHLTSLLEDSFAKAHRRLPTISFRKKSYGFWKYHAKFLEESLKEFFPSTQRLLDQDSHSQPDFGVHAAVRTRSVGSFPIVFSNYPSDKTYTDLTVWESARATMTNKVLFKPFVHPKLGPLTIDRTKDSNNAVSIATEEVEAYFGEDHEPMVDIVVSLGGCTTQEAFDSSAQKAEARDEGSWQELLERKRAQSLEAATTRVQLRLHEVPNFDDLSSITRIQSATRSFINPALVREIAGRLFASLFYVDSTTVVEEPADNGFLITTQILCRIPSDSPDIYRLGELLLDGTFEGLAFVFREEGYRTQRLIIPPETIENDLMAHRPFTVPKLRIHVTEKNATVFAGILLITGEQFELSGFPRQLVRGSRRFNRRSTHTKDQVDAGTGIATGWNAPSLRDMPSPTALSINTDSSQDRAESPSSYLRSPPHSPLSLRNRPFDFEFDTGRAL